MIIYHQHPSGVATPSTSDKVLTRQLVDVLKVLDIRVIDHIVIGETPYSFAENGLL